MKKLGIFTLTDALNYGAFYQMFALQQYLKEDLENEYSITVYSPKENFKGNLIKYFSFSLKRFYRKSILRLKFNKCMNDVCVKSYNGEHLDIAFFGSDEIWNVDNDSFVNDPNFYGIAVNASLKIAYAPSIGYATIDSFNNFPNFIEGIKSLNEVLYRDNATKELIQKKASIKGERVIDPTILFDNWETYKLKSTLKIGKPYIVYYSYLSEPPFKKALIEYSKKNNLSIISAGFNVHSWADENLVLNPWDFLKLISGAKCVFTTTFHGTIMSMLLEKPLLFSPLSHKVKDLSKMFELQEYEINEFSTVEDIDNKLDCYDPSKIKIRKNFLKNKSRTLISKICLSH